MMHLHSFRHGYILLISVLIIGAISAGVLSSLLLLGTSASQTAIAVKQSAQALAAANACAEDALFKLRQSPAYSGNESITLDNSDCDTLTIGGVGNTNRLVCTEGHSGDAVRRIQIVVSQILQSTLIDSWQEVPAFTLCEG